MADERKAGEAEQELFSLLEEKERRGTLAPRDRELVREARRRGLFKSTRDAEAVALEERILKEDPNSYTDMERYGIINQYYQLTKGETDDFDGRKRFGKKLDSLAYWKETRALLSPDRYKSEIPNKVAEFNAKDKNGQLAMADEIVKNRDREFAAVENKPGGLKAGDIELREKYKYNPTLRQIIQSKASGVLPYDVAPLKSVDEMDEADKQKLIAAGREEAFRQSYVPYRQWLENKLLRNRTALEIAREATQTESFDKERMMAALSPDERQVVSSYVRQARPFDTEEGPIGTLEQAGREFLHAWWQLGKGSVDMLRKVGEMEATALWALTNPEDAFEWEDAIEQERKVLRLEDYTFSPKDPVRSFLGEGVVGAAQSTPIMLAIAYGQVYGATGVTLSVGDSTFENLRAKGATPEQAFVGGAIGGLSAVLCERIGGLAGTTKLGKAFSKPVITRAMSAGMLDYISKPRNLARFAEMWGRGASAEWFEEYIDAFVNNTTEQAILDNKVEFRKLLKDTWADAKDSTPSVAVMTFFGSGKSAVSEMSENAADIEYHERMIEHVSKSVWERIQSDKDRFAEGQAEVNDVIVDTWLDNPKDKAIRELNKLGIKKADITPEVEQSLNVMAEVRKGTRQQLATDQKRIEAQEQAYSRLVESMEKIGIEPQIVEKLTQSLDPRNVGQISGKAIEILDDISDPNRVFSHETWHFAIDEMGLSEKEWDVLRKAAKRPEYREARIRYADLTGDARVEDIMGDVWAEWTPQEKTIFKKVVDWVKQLFGVVTEQDVFEKVDNYLKQMGEATQQQTQKEGETKFARRSEPMTVESAATAYALARVEGRNADDLAKRIAEKHNLDEAEIKSKGASRYNLATDKLDADASIAERRIGVRTEANKRALFTRERKAMAEGVKLAKEAQKEEKSAERKQATKKRQIESKLRRAAPDTVTPAHLLKAVMTNDADSFLKEMDERSLEFAEENNVEDSDLKSSIYKHTLSKNLWQIIAKLPYNRSRSFLQNKLAQLRKESTKKATADKLARTIIERLHEVDTLAKAGGIKKMFTKLFKTEVGSKPAEQTLQVDKQLSKDDHNMLLVVKQLFNKSEKSVDSILEDIDSYDSSAFDPDKTRGMLERVREYIPRLKDMGLEPQVEIAYAKAMIEKWGAMGKGNMQQLADGLLTLRDELQQAKQEQIEAAREQSNKIKKGQSYLRIGTQNKSGKKAFLTSRPVFQEISMRLRELSLFASKRGKESMDKLIKMLQFQKSSDTFNKVMREGADKFATALQDNYGGKFLDKMIIKLNSKQRKWAKYNVVDGTAMSKSQLMQLVAVYRQEEYKSNMRSMGYNDSIMADIEAELTDADQQFLLDLYDIYQEMGSSMDKVSQSLWGVDVSNKSPFYLPVTVDSTTEWTGVEVRTVPVAPPSTIRRVDHNKPIDITMGITEMWDSRISQTASFIAHAESNALAKSVFSDTESVKQIEKTFGKSGVWTGVKNHLNDIYSNGGGDSFRSKGLRMAVNFITMRALSGNLKMPFVQLTSLPSYALQFGSLNFTKMVASGAVNPESYFNSMKAIFNSDQFKDRISLGGTEFMEQALRERFGVSTLDAIPMENARDAGKFMGSLIKRMYRYGMMTNKIGDVGPILLLAPAIHLDEMRKTGNAEEAMTNTWEVVNLTQQSFATKNRSVLSRRGFVLGKILSAFTTTPGQFMAFESQAFRALSARVQQDGFAEALKSPEARKMADTLFINHVLLPGMYYTVSTVLSNFIRGDEWDDDDINGLIITMATGPFAAWAIFAGLTKDFFNAAMDGDARVFGGLLPIDSFRNDARLLGEIVKHGLQGDFDEMLETAGEELQNIVTPAKQIMQAVENN